MHEVGILRVGDFNHAEVLKRTEVADDPAEAAALYNRVWDLAIRAAIREGGVINEHHGVGLKLGRLMKELYGPAMYVLEDIKKQLVAAGAEVEIK